MRHPECTVTTNHHGHNFPIDPKITVWCDGRCTTIFRDEQCDSAMCTRIATHIWAVEVDARFALVSGTTARMKLCQGHHEFYETNIQDHLASFIGQV